MTSREEVDKIIESVPGIELFDELMNSLPSPRSIGQGVSFASAESTEGITVFFKAVEDKWKFDDYRTLPNKKEN